MNQVPLHHVRRVRKVAVDGVDCPLGRARVVAQRMNGVLRNRTYPGRNGCDDDSAHVEGAGGLSIAPDVADHVSGCGEVGGCVADSEHAVSANDVVDNGAASADARAGTVNGAADGVVVNDGAHACCLLVVDASEAGARPGPTVIDGDCADVVIVDDIAVLKAEI